MEATARPWKAVQTWGPFYDWYILSDDEAQGTIAERIDNDANAALIVQAVSLFDLLVVVRDKAESALDLMAQGQPETYQLRNAIAELDAIWPEGSIRGKVQAKLDKGE